MRPTSCCRRGLSAAFVALAIAAVAPAAAGAAPSSTAPGAPGAKAFWTPANKQGFGTSMTTQSKLWHTLQGGELTEVYYPDLEHAGAARPAAHRHRRQDLHRSRDRRDHPARRAGRQAQPHLPPDQHGEVAGATGSSRPTSPTRRATRCWSTCASSRSPAARYQVYAYVDPSLSNDGSDDSGTTSHGALLTQDAQAGSALVAAPSFGRTSTGYLDASDGWVDLRDDHRMDWHYRSSPNGNVVQTAETQLDGRRHQHLQLALGFGATSGAALATARASLQRGFGRVAGAYADGWHRYLGSLKPMPAQREALRRRVRRVGS